MVKKTNILPDHTTNLYPDKKLEKLPPNKDYLYIFRGDENKGYGELSAFQALLSQKKNDYRRTLGRLALCRKLFFPR